MKHYLKITFRHLWRNRLFTLLNIAGLSIGISASWVIYRIVDYEFSYNKQQPDEKRIFQVMTRNLQDGKETTYARVGAALPAAVAKDVSGIALAVPVYTNSSKIVSIPRTGGREPTVFNNIYDQIRTVPAYFEMTPYRWLAGNKRSALDAPEKLVLTQSRASMYFPEMPIGQVLGKTILRDTMTMQVSGVVADLDGPGNLDAAEFSAIPENDRLSDNWDQRLPYVTLYVKLKKGVEPVTVLRQINVLNKVHNKSDFEKYNFKGRYEFLPLSEVHFAQMVGEEGRTADKHVLYGLVAVAAFLLALACVNYINLSTAQIPGRAREIGIRKTMGVHRGQLIFQFLGETLIITWLAVGCSFMLSMLATRLFQEFMPEGMDLYQNYGRMVFFALCLSLLITGLSGIYPAWLITRVQTVHTLKGQTAKVLSKGKLTLRKGLIVFQFVIAQVFIIGALIIGQQLRYLLEADLGFNKDAVIVMDIPYDVLRNPVFRHKEQVLKEELLKYPSIEMAAIGDRPMAEMLSRESLYFQDDSGKVTRQLDMKYADADLFKLYRFKLLAGHWMQPADSVREYLINESAVRAFGFASAEAAIGKELISNERNTRVRIGGVINDFHQQGFKNEINPLVYCAWGMPNTLNVKLHASLPSQWPKAIQTLEANWKKTYPGVPFVYKFYDESIAWVYKQEHTTDLFVKVATGITLLVSCLGLFGLATLTAYQRTKEIGIRKVLGATVSAIVGLLSKDFIKLVCLAMVIASPIAWWAMHHWLRDYAYKIEIRWWVFIFGGGIAVVIALLTVSYQAIRAATANPVDSLRDE